MEIVEDGLPVRPAQNREAQFHIINVGRGSEAGLVAITTTEGFRLSFDTWLQDSWKEIGAGTYALQTDYLDTGNASTGQSPKAERQPPNWPHSMITCQQKRECD